MLELCSLGSGSKGNAYVVGEDGAYVLVDCGISSRRLCRALERAGVPIDAIEGILVSHEHRDHVSGLESFRRKCPAPLYATYGTLDCISRPGRGPTHPIEAGRPFAIGPFRIHPFSVCHDAVDPVGFRVESGSGPVAFATDLGSVNEAVRRAISGVRALVIESNHDEEMLRAGSYPWYLKERILSDFGHLSNRASQAALAGSAHEGLEVVLLAHLSEENNDPELALEGARAVLRANRWDGVKLIVARQEVEGETVTFP
ncbi:MAG: MBL fold metallo-hydrolase [Candidatus Eisenbacteria bacterium]